MNWIAAILVALFVSSHLPAHPVASPHARVPGVGKVQRGFGVGELEMGVVVWGPVTCADEGLCARNLIGARFIR